MNCRRIQSDQCPFSDLPWQGVQVSGNKSSIPLSTIQLLCSPPIQNSPLSCGAGVYQVHCHNFKLAVAVFSLLIEAAVLVVVEVVAVVVAIGATIMQTLS